MKFKVVVLLALISVSLLNSILVLADDLYQQDDILAITKETGFNMDEFYRPKADILIDAKTGSILYGDNIDVVRDSGSMAKLMTAYVLFLAIKDGKLNYDTVITASASDQAISENSDLSNVPIYAGVDYPISDLINMLFVPSSSAATIMIANAVSDNDPDAFLDLMNQRAQEIGMTNSKWYNPNGAPTSVLRGLYTPTRYDNHATNEITARDMAILGYHLVNEFPEALDYTKNSSVTVMKGTPYQATYDNYNASLEGGKHALKGADGLKTGSSPTADYNYSVTVKRGNQRFIEIIMGVGHYDVELAESYRHIIGNALAEKMFQEYEYKEILTAGEHQINGKTYQLEQPFYATVKKGTQPTLTVKNNQLSVDNGLQSLSPNIKTTLTVTEKGGFFSLPNTTNAVKFNPMWIFCLLPIGILKWIFMKTNSTRK
ncbi:D-alanyl-D-alanine carboxypeptidase [Streptococcus sp. DD10]|uniref:DUF1958 domain-containing protein n=1 Tax=Streptococcus sp. DD10 TaxID=1777878 RepID=UPI000797305D|nr:DUF1958 domain-containing protein [Streptococcus sp. DD10]KXT72458.1 D-alanyl-D-alanine carboxypeptidase [Streptococcus sp. DD10]